MKLALNRDGWWFKELTELPESGMGYQVVDITLHDGRFLRRVVVINGEYIFLPAEYENVSEKDITEIRISIY